MLLYGLVNYSWIGRNYTKGLGNIRKIIIPNDLGNEDLNKFHQHDKYSIDQPMISYAIEKLGLNYKYKGGYENAKLFKQLVQTNKKATIWAPGSEQPTGDMISSDYGIFANHENRFCYFDAKLNSSNDTENAIMALIIGIAALIGNRSFLLTTASNTGTKIDELHIYKTLLRKLSPIVSHSISRDSTIGAGGYIKAQVYQIELTPVKNKITSVNKEMLTSLLRNASSYLRQYND